MRLLVAVLASLLMALPASAQTASPSPAATLSEPGLAGLWGSERTFGPLARGMLTLDLRAEPYVASISGFAVPVRRSGAALVFRLPAEQGDFRGRVGSDGSVSGMWTQPETRTSGSRYATPVRLRAIAPNVWRGIVSPLEDRISLYLSIVQRAGRLRAFLRNPELNIGVGRPFTVAISGSGVTFANADDASDTIVASYDARSDSLTLPFPDYGPLVFTRRTRDTAVGFYPRTPDVTSYVYRQPVAENDGWRTASLDAAGLNAAPLRALVDGILTAKTDWYNAPYVQGLLMHATASSHWKSTSTGLKPIAHTICAPPPRALPRCSPASPSIRERRSP